MTVNIMDIFIEDYKAIKNKAATPKQLLISKLIGIGLGILFFSLIIGIAFYVCKT